MSDAPLAILERRPRSATRLGTSRDRGRARAIAIAAFVAALASVVAFALHPPSSRSDAVAAVGAPHASSACASCHEAGSMRRACVSCHAEHRSSRAGHAALVARGALACTSCHAMHGEEQQGVRFTSAHDAVRWGGDGELRLTTAARGNVGDAFALVPAARCAHCHDLSRAADPLRRCVADPGDPRALTTCFDEHRASSAKQIASSDAAREAARAMPFVRPSSVRRLPWVGLASGVAAGALAFVAAVRGRRRARTNVASPPPAPRERVRLPVIDASRCLGCFACVDACAFDVLAIERYVAKVVRPADCCGAVTCERACPNGSLRITEQRGSGVRPRVDEHLESPRARGVFLAGDLTGLPLIKNAIAQGTAVVDRIASSRPTAAPRDPRSADLIVIGAGPAGLAAALRASERGLSCLVLEQATIAATIRSFPRDKLVYDAPLELPIEGALRMRESTKEALLGEWLRVVRMHRIDVREGHRAVGFERDGRGWTVTADAAGQSLRFVGARVLLAIGRRGSPTRLDAAIAPGAETMVSYALADARSFAGKRVLVVGLGDAAMETAIALAAQPATRVVVSYRGDGFARGKARNIEALRRLVDAGRVRLHLRSRVVSVTRGAVVLATPNGEDPLPCDAVIVQIGGAPSWALVRAAGVEVIEDGVAHVDAHATERRE